MYTNYTSIKLFKTRKVWHNLSLNLAKYHLPTEKKISRQPPKWVSQPSSSWVQLLVPWTTFCQETEALPLRQHPCWKQCHVTHKPLLLQEGAGKQYQTQTSVNGKIRKHKYVFSKVKCVQWTTVYLKMDFLLTVHVKMAFLFNFLLEIEI